MYQSPTFVFPKRKDNTMKKNTSNSSLGAIFESSNLHKAFPFISTNISSFNTNHDNFIIANSPNAEPPAVTVQESSFRPQNKFILARSIIGSLLSSESKKASLVSKVAGNVCINRYI